MNRTIFFIVVMIISLQLYPQGDQKKEYEKFKIFFTAEPDSSTSIGYDIPLELVAKVTGDKRIVDEYVESIKPRGVFETAESTCFIVESFSPQGGYVSDYIILSFVKGAYKNSKAIGFNSIKYNGGKSSSIKTINDTVLEVCVKEIEFSESGEERIVSSPFYSYYVFNSQGYHLVRSTKISKERLFPQVSTRVLDASELSQYGKNELDIMRNEIFADHGYIFNSKRWKDYFARQKWYYPCYNDVLDFLTVIEEINIERILAIAPK